MSLQSSDSPDSDLGNEVAIIAPRHIFSSASPIEWSSRAGEFTDNEVKCPVISTSIPVPNEIQSSDSSDSSLGSAASVVSQLDVAPSSPSIKAPLNLSPSSSPIKMPLRKGRLTDKELNSLVELSPFHDLDDALFCENAVGWIPPELHFGVPITRDLCLRLYAHVEELLGSDSESDLDDDDQPRYRHMYDDDPDHHERDKEEEDPLTRIGVLTNMNAALEEIAARCGIRPNRVRVVSSLSPNVDWIASLHTSHIPKKKLRMPRIKAMLKEMGVEEEPMWYFGPDSTWRGEKGDGYCIEL